MVIFHSYVSLPEGNHWITSAKIGIQLRDWCLGMLHMPGMVGGFNKNIWLDLMKIWLRWLGIQCGYHQYFYGEFKYQQDRGALRENETTF